MDECTGYCWSYFLKGKHQLKDRIDELVDEMNDQR